jgi:hypothetical protein
MNNNNLIRIAAEVGQEYADDLALDELLKSADKRSRRNIVASDSDASVSLYADINREYAYWHRRG